MTAAPMVNTAASSAALGRTRPKAGERRVQILQALAAMLENPAVDRVTTAALAQRLEISEAALYRHFASKAQMFDALIEYIEQTIFARYQHILEQERTPQRQVMLMAACILQFAETNPGMARVMLGDALLGENERLLLRLNGLFDKIEAQLRACLLVHVQSKGSPAPEVQAKMQAAVLFEAVHGRLLLYVRSGFTRKPSDSLEAALEFLVP